MRACGRMRLETGFQDSPGSPHKAPPTHARRSDALLSSVLERGSGGCAALCILYVSVCARAGLPMHFRVLRDDAGSHYCVAWPAAAPLRAPGVGRCVVDVYGRGALLTVDEVCAPRAARRSVDAVLRQPRVAAG